MEEMTNSNLRHLLEFLRIVGRLKKTPRSGWLEVGIPEPESVADHTFRTSILCMIYSDLEHLDELKMLRMALIHDLPEAIMGDLTPSRKVVGKKNEENVIMKNIASLLPKMQVEKLMYDWHEYREGKTREAKALRQLEKLEMALQAKEYENTKAGGYNLNMFIKSAEEAIFWPELKRLISFIRGKEDGDL